MNDMLTIYKLIILKMLALIVLPLSNSQISEFILEKEYTNYFTLQKILFELAESGLIIISSHHNQSLYHITNEGKRTLSFFEYKIPDSIKQDIQVYLKEHQIEIRDSRSIVSDYFPGNSDDFLVRCQVREQDSTLIELTLSVPDKEQAVSMCNHWKEKSQEIYEFVMKNLL